MIRLSGPLTGQRGVGDEEIEVGGDLQDRGHPVYGAQFIESAFVARPEHLTCNVIGGARARRHELKHGFKALSVVCE